MTDNDIPDDIKAAMESVAKKAFDAGHAAGAAGENPDFFEYSNRKATRRVDTAHANYEAELKPLLSELRKDGVRNLKNHPRVLALQARHGR